MAEAFEGVEDIDPAAEFIAREQSAMAELDHVAQVNGGNAVVTEEETVVTLDNVGDSNDLTNNVSNSVSVNNLSNQMNGVDKEPVKEPEKIRKWRDEQQNMLKQKDEEEVQKKKELGEQAKKELDEWYARYDEQLNKSKVINREACKNAEKEWIAERDAESPGQEWEKIARMCDFNPKASRNSKDTSRMRSILLQLKQQQQTQ